MKLITATDVGKELHLTSRQVMIGILNGTLPIGTVIPAENEREKWKCRIVKERYEKWKKGEM